MPYSSPEVLQLEGIRDWMDTLSVWTSWAGLNQVVWPIKAVPALPACVLSLNGGRTVNLTGAAGGANFQPSGSITMWIYSADTDTGNIQSSYTAFADLFYRLIAQMSDYAHEAPVFLNSFTTPDIPIVHSSWINSDDSDDGLSAWWQGQVTIQWGVQA